MAIDSEPIRNEIKYILERVGVTRSAKLVAQVIQKVGSEKTVYREIKNMAKYGEIRKIGSGQNISYDIPSVTEQHNLLVWNLLDIVKNNYEYLDSLHAKIDSKTKLFHLEALMTIVTGIKQLQTVEARFKIMKIFPALKKLRVFDEIESQIEKNWRLSIALILHNLDQTQEPDLMSQVLRNFEPIRYGFLEPLQKVKKVPTLMNQKNSKSEFGLRFCRKITQ